MAKKNWKRVYPHSLRHAMEQCVEYAKQTKNLSVDRIADLMGEESHFTLYKWLDSGRMPAIKIRPFEHACGINFVTQYLAHSDGKLLITIPTGKKAAHEDLAALSLAMHETAAQLIRFYNGEAEPAEVIGQVTGLMEDLGFHRGNIEKDKQPELELAE